MPKRTRPIILYPEDPFDEALRAFKRGGVLAYPTETFYGLGVDPFNEKAVEALFSLKGRPCGKPVSIIVKDRATLLNMVEEVPPAAEKLMKKFWPGPLTIVFNASNAVPLFLTGGTANIAARVSGNRVTQRLVAEINSPVTATSANPSGKRAPVEAREVIDYFDGSIDVLIDGGRLSGKLGSTIVDVTGTGVEVLREGEVPAIEIFKCLKD